MAWWRHDPSLSSHPNRLIQRIVRDQALLQPRRVTRTQFKAAQLQDDDGGKRPPSMSNLEWMQLQHCKRWTKRLRDDPYQAIFGASNDMLTGKGLKDWDWIHRKFPKWMLKEMDLEKSSQNEAFDNGERSKVDNANSSKSGIMQGRSADGNATFGESRYPKSAKIANDNAELPGRRDSYFPQPSFRSSRFERDNSSGIVSPSDSRRPKEDSQMEHFERPSIQSSESTTNMDAPSNSFTATSKPSRDFDSNDGLSQKPPKEHETQASSQDASMRESSFINEFLTDLRSQTKVDQDSWRQTVLQICLMPRAKPVLSTQQPIVSEAGPPTVPPTASIAPIPSSQASEMILGDQFSETRIKDAEKLKQYPLKADLEKSSHEEQPIPTRSTSQVLSHLPAEDIDFLSADDIRANMGTKRSRSPTNEQRMAEKRELDHKFTKAIQQGQELDPMIESQILNDQLIRRKERELREAEQSEKTAKSQATDSPAVNIADNIAGSGIDRMKRWLETTGVSFAKHFWQDPTEETDVKESRLFFDKAYHCIRKGRAAMAPIIEDLEKDLPASMPFLDLLKKDEETLESSINRLHRPSQSDGVQDLPPKKTRAIESIKAKHDQTNSELEKAYAALRSLASTTAISGVPESFKRRLSMASEVLHKNMQLSRMLIYSFRTRLEDPNLDRTTLLNYKVVVDDLSSLADTQMTLVRLIDHAKSLYGVVSPSSKDSQLDEALQKPIQSLSACEEPFIRARLAADAHLLKEISAHNPGLDAIDDNSKVSNDTTTSAKKSLDELNPLTHSLFRPFAPVVERLSIQHDSDVVTEDDKKVEKARDEADTAVEVTKERRFEMLNEDPAISDLVSVSQKGPVEAVNHIVKDRAPAPPNATSGDLRSIAASPATSKPTNTSEPREESLPRRETTADAFSSVAAAPDKDLSTSFTVSPTNCNVPTHYTILIRDPLTDNLTLTTSTTPAPRDTSPAIPLHQALAELNAPAKFLPYITEGLEVITAKKDMLILRDSLDDTTSTRPFSTVNTAKSKLEDSVFTKHTINPIDGTVPLSPTGYVGPEESPEQLEREFEERRQAAGRLARSVASEQDLLVKGVEKAQPKEERKRRGAGIVKTAIWAMVVCYVVGVIGEISAGSSGL